MHNFHLLQKPESTCKEASKLQMNCFHVAQGNDDHMEQSLHECFDDHMTE